MVGLFMPFENREHMRMVLQTIPKMKDKRTIQRIAIGKATDVEIKTYVEYIKINFRNLDMFGILIGQALATHESGGLKNGKFLE